MSSDCNLSDALDSSPDSSPRSSQDISDPCCCDMQDIEDQTFRLDDGLDLQISTNRRTLQGVANLVLAVNRMKPPLALCSPDLSEGELCSAIMDCVVEETIAETTISATGQQRTFYRANSVNEYSICDLSQKDIIHQSGEFKLQAITLKGGYQDRRVYFKMSRYFPFRVCHDDGESVLLSVAKNLHLSCTMIEDAVVLNLEECSEQDLTQIKDNENMARYLFFRRNSGVSMNTFESLKYRGWFISTSSQPENQTVEMCTVDATCRHREFKLNT
ncbi:interleukin-1 beta [Parambassis ranga]|uniref:Interleukin-1 beta n=1 Tax=Parambassis ranga TaxID=210632 RepID=A0A6P7JAE7_9TELE|nr:interleukin-1 beta-like [Parambassis ranga]